MSAGRLQLFVIADDEVIVGIEAYSREQAEEAAAREGCSPAIGELLFCKPLLVQGGESRVVFRAQADTNSVGDVFLTARRHQHRLPQMAEAAMPPGVEDDRVSRMRGTRAELQRGERGV